MSAVIITLKEGITHLPESEIVRQLGSAGYSKRLIINPIFMARRQTQKYLAMGQPADIQELLTSVSCQKLDFTISQYDFLKRELDSSINGVQVAFKGWRSDGQAKKVAHLQIMLLTSIITDWRNMFTYSSFPTKLRVDEAEETTTNCFKFVIYPRTEFKNDLTQVLNLLYDYFSNFKNGHTSVHFNKDKNAKKVSE